MLAMSIDEMREAAQQLSRSRVGTNALRVLLKWMDEDGLNLDAFNREAVATLLSGAWGPFAGSARDVMREALGENAPQDL
jgi:hypothetical protein